MKGLSRKQSRKWSIRVPPFGDLISVYPQLKKYFAIVEEGSSDLAITQERLTNVMRSAGISNVSETEAETTTASE